MPRSRRQFGKLRKLPSGRYQASYIDGSGQRVNAPTTFQTKGDASAWLAAAQTDMHRGTLTPEVKPKKRSTMPTFSEYATNWLADRELKPRTRDEYRKLIGLPKDGAQASPRKDARNATTLLDTFGGAKLDAITAETVKAWYKKLDPSKPTHRAHLYALLRTIMGTALEDGHIAANPCAIKAGGRSKRARRIEPATVDELKTIAAAVPEQWAMLVQLAAWCALRFGELTELRRKDVDLSKGILKVSRGVTWVDGQPVVGSPKSEAGARDVAIPPHLLQPLAAHMRDHVGDARDALLFHALGSEGQHLAHGTFYKHWRKARAAAGRPDLRLHDCRHTGAVMYAQAGGTTKELMTRLGHTTPAMAMNYQHVARGRDSELAAKLSEMASGT